MANLDLDAVRRYVVALRERGWAANTVAIHIRNIRAFLRWCHEEGCAETNLARAVEAPKRVVRLEEPLTPEELLLLVGACQGDAQADRDRALIWFFTDTGLRLGELTRLRRDQVHFSETGAWLQIYARKTNTIRFVILGETTAVALRVYLEGREDDIPALWVGRRGALTTRGIYKATKRRARLAGMDPNRVHPHLFRKTFVNLWTDNNGDPERLRVLAGWSSMEMLQIYVGTSRKKLEEAHRQAGPVDRLLE